VRSAVPKKACLIFESSGERTPLACYFWPPAENSWEYAKLTSRDMTEPGDVLSILRSRSADRRTVHAGRVHSPYPPERALHQIDILL